QLRHVPANSWMKRTARPVPVSSTWSRVPSLLVTNTRLEVRHHPVGEELRARHELLVADRGQCPVRDEVLEPDLRLELLQLPGDVLGRSDEAPAAPVQEVEPVEAHVLVRQL